MDIKQMVERCYVIAEIGGNFTTYEQAKRLIDAASHCGVDAIKLQTYRADTVASRKAMFDMENTGRVSQYDLLKKYEIDEALHKRVFSYAAERRLNWFSTPAHETDADMLERLDVGAFKVGSDDAVNIPFLRYLARKGRAILLSTGMCTMDEVRQSVSAILSEGNRKLILLHAVTSYPTHPEHVNLRAIQSLKREFPEFVVGYSDHTIGTTACICAVAMGAGVLEKHFTYDKNAEGPDHMLSADIDEMAEIVRRIREYEVMRGSGIKMPAKSEEGTRLNNRKSIVLNKDMRSGEIIGNEHIAVKRPGTGIEPKYYEGVLGRRVIRDMKQDDILQWLDLA